jgi:hypothetical protein
MNKWHKRISVILKRNELNTRTVWRSVIIDASFLF